MVNHSRPEVASTEQSSSKGQRLGHFELIRNLGHSRETAAWLVTDTRSQEACVLVMPKAAIKPEQWPDWESRMRKIKRIESPLLAPITEFGQLVGRPYICYARAETITLAERMQQGPMSMREACRIMHQLTQALSSLHDSRCLHRDVQPHLVLVHGKNVQLCGAEISYKPVLDTQQDPLDADRVELREGIPQDLLYSGLMMHWLFSGLPPMGENDFSLAANRIPPQGKENIELPPEKWAALNPPIRHIYQRALNPLPRQRFASARSFASAIEETLQGDMGQGPNVLATLRERIRMRGMLPGNEDTMRHVIRMSRMQVSHQSELVSVLLEDTALSLELLRVCNNALRKGETLNANSAVLNIRRAVALAGLNGIEQAAKNLTLWPGGLNRYQARDLEDDLWQIRRASVLAQLLNPGAFEPETVFIMALFHGLGQLLLGYHFPEESLQIKHLVKLSRQERPEQSPWLALDMACQEVLGIPVRDLAAELLRLWGLENDVVEMLQPLPSDALTQGQPQDDSLLLRGIVSCAYEVFVHKDTVQRQRLKVLNSIAQRYEAWLGCTAYTLNDALRDALKGSEHRVIVGSHDITETEVAGTREGDLHRQNVNT